MSIEIDTFPKERFYAGVGAKIVAARSNSLWASSEVLGTRCSRFGGSGCIEWKGKQVCGRCNVAWGDFQVINWYFVERGVERTEQLKKLMSGWESFVFGVRKRGGGGVLGLFELGVKSSVWMGSDNEADLKRMEELMRRSDKEKLWGWYLKLAREECKIGYGY